MSRRSKLSILLPTYNGQRFLCPQVDSILSQTAQDCEVLVIDDGSTDGTRDIADGYARQDSRIRVVPASGNIGHKLRLRQLISLAAGDFIAIADQDDVWLPDRNERLLDAIGDKAIAFGRSQLIDAEGRYLGSSLLEESGVDAHTAGFLQTRFRPLGSAHAAIIRRAWLDAATLYGYSPFDWMFGLEAMRSSGLIYDDEAIVLHRIHGANQSNGDAHISGGWRATLRRLNNSLKRERPHRFSFMLAADQLSRSLVIDGEARTRMHHVAAACRYGWFHPLDLKSARGKRLERVLRELLDGLASSAQDKAVFHEQLRAMLDGPLSPKRVLGGVVGLVTSRVADRRQPA